LSIKDKSNNENQKDCNKKNNPWFIATLFLCVAVLILSGIVFYVIKPKPGEVTINSLFKTDKGIEPIHTVCIEEDMTLAQIAVETELSLKQVCKTLNIDENTDPNTKLSELFDIYELNDD
jgi:hypothetical protein